MQDLFTWLMSQTCSLVAANSNKNAFIDLYPVLFFSWPPLAYLFLCRELLGESSQSLLTSAIIMKREVLFFFSWVWIKGSYYEMFWFFVGRLFSTTLKNLYSPLMNQAMRYVQLPCVFGPITLASTEESGWLQIVIWDALTAEKVAKWPSNHIGAPRWLEHSPTEAAFVSCGTDRSIRFWKETQ